MPSINGYYKGTQLTGTSKEAKKFSNLSNYYHGEKVHYRRNDEYYNTKTGHLYVCRQGAAEAKDSMWAYVRTEITKAPGRLATISISKSNDTSLTFTAKFKWIASDYESTSTSRATRFAVSMKLKTDKNHTYTISRKSLTAGAVKSFTEWSVSLKGALDTLYPSTKGSVQFVEKAKLVYFEVEGSNERGEATGNKSSSYKFSTPRTPTISAMTYNPDNGEISCTITADEGKDSHQRVDTVVTVSKTNTLSSPKTVVEAPSRFTGKTASKKYDVSNAALLTGSNYAALRVMARSRGIAGNSAWTKERILYVSKPQNVAIKTGTKHDGGSTIVPINIKPKDEQHPVTGVRLQVLQSSQYTSASQIPSNANWRNVGSVDDGQCKALACDTGEIVPDPGTFSWVRIKAWNLDEDDLHTYSEPKRLKSLETELPTAADDVCRISSVTTGEDGSSAFVTVVWKSDDSNATEVSWSNNENAWISTEQPQTFTMDDATWRKTGTTTIDGVTYNYKATLNVVSLDSEDTWHFSARRIRDFDGETPTRGAYCKKVKITPSRAPTEVSMYVPDYIITGDDLRVSWDFDGIDSQTMWKIRSCQSGTKSTSDPVMASGNGVSWNRTVPWSLVRSKMFSGQSGKVVGTIGKWLLNVYVDVTTKSGTTSSAVQQVAIVDKPVISLSSMPSVPSQPATLTVQSSTNNASLLVVVRSTGASEDAPDGYRTQASGDVVWSSAVYPKWAPAQSYSSQSSIAAAKRALDAAEASYADAESQMQALEGEYVSAWVAYNNAASNVADLREALPNATNALNEAQAYLDTLEQGDDGYEEAAQAVSDANQYLTSIQTQLGTQQSPGPAVVAESEALEEMNDALDALDSYDMSTAIANLEDARASYYAAEAAYIPTVSSSRPYAATVGMPTGLDLIDGATYSVAVVAVESSVGVRSDEVTGTFSVNLSHKAPQPSDDVIVEPFDITDELGYRTIGALVTLTDSSMAASTDTYEVYRVTQDGSSLVAGGLSGDSSVIDPYAPFGNSYLRYRVACRTDDGDVAWRDYDYYLMGDLKPGTGFLRIDWGSEYVELEHSVSHSDSYQKGFESRKHLDGAISGHWDEGTARTASLDATLIRGFESNAMESIRRLARYSGPCMVRTIDGTAYEADVEVDGVSPSSGTVNVGVSMSATEIGMTEEFMALEVPSA